MAPTCLLEGNADMYGLGIRVGYYLQWYGILLAAWICPQDVPALRLTNTFFIASTFLALLTQVPNNNLDVVEIYITLLFTFGSSLYSLPVLLWRILTRCSARRDPSRFPKAKPPSGMYNVLNSLLQISVLVFQSWFWVKRVPSLKDRSCMQYGFLFTKVALDMSGFRILNVVLTVLLMVLLTVFLGLTPFAKRAEKVLKIKNEPIHPSLIRVYHLYDSASKLFLATTIVSATELSIHWNAIHGVNAINSAGQTIPLVLGIGTFLRIIYIALKSRYSKKGGIQKAQSQKPTEPKTKWYHIPQTMMPAPVGPTSWTHTPSPIFQAPSSALANNNTVSPMRPYEMVPQSATTYIVSPEASPATYGFTRTAHQHHQVPPENYADRTYGPGGEYQVNPEDSATVNRHSGYQVSPMTSTTYGQGGAGYQVSPLTSAEASSTEKDRAGGPLRPSKWNYAPVVQEVD